MRELIVFLFIILGTNVSATEYYVTTTGNNGNSGLSESTSFKTLSYAATKARSGDIVWIKAGKYGNENVVFKYNGSKGALISFIGYKYTPGDIKTNYFSYQPGQSLNSNEMPLIDGKNRAKGIGLKLYGRSFIQIKNIQITNYRYCIDALAGANNLIFDNIVASNAGGTSQFLPISGGNCIRMDTNTNHHNKISNSVVMNATMVAITVGGDHNIIENNKTYADQDDINGDKRSMDYHVLVSGSNNILRNHYAEHVGDLAHTGHGFALKSLGVEKSRVENNLIENCDIVNINGSIEFRHRQVKYNIARDIRIEGKTSRYAGGFHFRDGASFNIVENSYVKNLTGLNGAISFYDTSEDGGTQWSASDNIIKNTIFENCELGIRLGSGKQRISDIKNNKILNCTFNNIKNFYRVYPGYIVKDNILENSIISKVENRYYGSIKTNGWTESYNNYYDNKFSKIAGTGNVSVDPQFQDESRGNYRLKSTSKLIDAGKKKPEVLEDFDGNERPRGKSHDIGAYEYHDTTTGSVSANAGEDVNICQGDSVTLTASGGGTYLWSSGESTQSIKISPSTSQVYTLVVTKGNETDEDEVEVIVTTVSADAGSDRTIEEGENVTLSASGGDTYLWSTGETSQSIVVKPSSTTNYKVTVFENNCEDSDTIQVSVKSIIANSPLSSANAGDDISICLGESVTLSGGGGDTYSWDTGDKDKDITVSPTRTTTYTLMASSGGISTEDTITVTVENCTAPTDEPALTTEFNVFPNPTTGTLNINVNSQSPELNLILIDMNGRVVFSDKLNSNHGSINKQINLSSAVKGIYFVRLFNNTENLVKKVFVI